MAKKIYYLSGLPRSGNTLLSSILNQNPEITATAHSLLPDIYYNILSVKQGDIYRYNMDDASLDSVLKSIHQNYYNNWNTDYIIERGDWITPFNINVLRQYPPNDIKIVILVRDILDILRSFMNVCSKHDDFYVNQWYNSLDKSTSYKGEVEEKCDFLMSKGNYIDTALFSINYLMNNDLLDHCKIVEYNDLVDNTESTLKGIYEYLDIPYYDSNLESFDQHSGYDLDIPLNKHLHVIQTDGVYKNDYKIDLPESVISKYSNLELWRR